MWPGCKEGLGHAASCAPSGGLWRVRWGLPPTALCQLGSCSGHPGLVFPRLRVRTPRARVCALQVHGQPLPAARPGRPPSPACSESFPGHIGRALVPRRGLTDGSSLWAMPVPSAAASPHAAPARSHFEKATETLPRVTGLGRPPPVTGAAVCPCPARARLPPPLSSLAGVAGSESGRVRAARRAGRRGAAPVPGLPLSQPASALPAMLGDHSSVPTDRALLSPPPKSGLSCKMVLQAVGKVLR